MPSLQDICAKPAEYGFEFLMGEVSTEKGTVSLGMAPIVHILDVLKFNAAFPGVIPSLLDGSSARVLSQAATRAALEKNHSVKLVDLKVLALGRVLGVKVKTVQVVEKEVPVFPLPDGTTTKDRAEFLAAYNLPAEVVAE